MTDRPMTTDNRNIFEQDKQPSERPDNGKAEPSTNWTDVSSLRLSQDFAATVGVKKLLTTVPIRKPTRQDFVRTHPDESYRVTTMVLELKEERETYLVKPELWPELPGEMTPKMLCTTINRQGVIFLWPIRLPGEDGRVDNWNQSALEAATHARTSWVRVAANMGLGAYELFEASGELPDPNWPDIPFQTLVDTAFKNLKIESIDHPVIKRLQGLV